MKNAGGLSATTLATFLQAAGGDTGRAGLAAPGLWPAQGEAMGGLGWGDPCWPAKRQNM